MYEAILFDLDQTLIDYRRTEELALMETWKRVVMPAAHMSYEAFVTSFTEKNDDLWPRYRRDEIDLDFLRTARFSFVTEASRDQISEDDVAAPYEVFLGAYSTLFNDALQALRTLHESREYKLGLVSNGIAAVQHRKLEVNDIREYFDTIIVSGEASFRKPDPRILNLALSELSTSRTKALYVGDSLESDGLCAKAAGIDFCWINREFGSGDSTPRVAEIHSLDELMGVVQSARV